MEGIIQVLWFSVFLCFVFMNSSAVRDTLSTNEAIKDGDGDTLVSADGMFELGFFSLGNSKNRYLGIQYKKISNGTVVWVANRDTPVNTTSGKFQISSNGILQLLNDGDTAVWSSSFVSLRNVTPVAQLLDNGNLVVRDESSTDQQTFIWQSFDYPGDTYLPGMKLGNDFIRVINRRWISWKSLDDPSPGEYTTWMDTNGYPQIFQGHGSVLQKRLGPWNGLTFSGIPNSRPDQNSEDVFVFNDKEVYFRFIDESSTISRTYFPPEGGVIRYIWANSTQSWFSTMTAIPTDICSRYGVCGSYGTCNSNRDPVCSCMEGFEPKQPQEWSALVWSAGCVRKKALDCGSGDEFRSIAGVKLPDTRSSWYNVNMTREECETKCQSNCSCTAYTNLDVRNGGSGCLIWFDELVDIREYNDTQNLYIRMVASGLSKLTTRQSRSNIKKQITIAVVSSVGFFLVGVTLAMYVRSKKKRSYMKRQDLNEGSMYDGRKEDIEIPSFSLSKISKSTNNFSITNKLGEGGFGPVYKGVLDDGQEIAVKRLSRTSRQGLDEFKNEVRCIAKLQHRNLVKLLGYCTQADEMMLIYEYLANKSLDLNIFDESRSLMLDWPQRYRIIHGIARGILYLHQDSRLRVIHRDLKAANVLLDHEMNPKISDFGLARMFKGYETEANTNKVVGTYGYISPEYAVHGKFSIKSDVFSFGVLVLEIVSGKKNRGFSHEEHRGNLLGHYEIL